MMERLKLDGVDLSTLAVGDGPTVVMLHGLVFGSMATWYSGFALPLSVSRRVVLYDQRGHGDSGHAASGYDLDTQASDLAGVLAHYAPHDQVDLVGHSMGALIALHFAIRHPGHVRRLVLVDAPMPAAEYIAPSFAGVTDPLKFDAFIDETTRSSVGGRRRAKLKDRLHTLFFDSTMVADVSAMHAESVHDLVQLALPTLLLYGADSPCRRAATTLRDALPDARLELMAGGHYLPEEAPAPLLAAIRDFLDGEAA